MLDDAGVVLVALLDDEEDDEVFVVSVNIVNQLVNTKLG